MNNLILIAAVSQNGVIGDNGKIPWHYPDDLERFKKMTLYHPIIMGRKTFESLGSPLPDRINIVVSRNEDFGASGIIVCRTIEEAVRRARNYGKIYVIGGQRVYEQTIEKATRLEITEVHRDFEGDAFFPEIDKNAWKEVKREDREVYSFVSYAR